MATCSCAGSTGTTYAANRGYGCLSSVPTSTGGIPYNCFLPPTNMSYYQNFPFYNGPCGTTPGTQNTNAAVQLPGCGCKPWFNPCCCNSASNGEAESLSSGMTAMSGGSGSSSSGCGCGCWNPCGPWNPCASCNPCCGPAALVATSSGSVTPAASSAVPLTQSTSTSSAISVEGDTITFKCPGVYLVILNSNIPASSTYVGNVSLALNGQTLGTTTQTFATSTAANNTTQAIVRASENSTLTVTTSAMGSAINPTPGTNLFTVTVIRIA